MQFLSNKQKGAIYALSSGLCYGFIGYFGTIITNDGLSVYNMLFWRFVVASLFAIIPIIFHLRLLTQNINQSLKIIFYGMSFYSGSSIFYFLASGYLGTGLAMVIFFTYPAFVISFNIIYYKAPVSRIYYIAFPLLVIGMMMLVDVNQFSFDLVGLFFGTLSSFSYACYILASKNTDADPLISTLMVSIGCAITCMLAAIIDHSLSIPTTPDSWLHISSLALVCTTIPILLLLRGLKYINPEQASMLSVLEPVFVVLVGIALLDEHITFMQVIGITTILCGAMLSLWVKGQS
jgi:drug/metabolite transporter (DMT)-like permease